MWHDPIPCFEVEYANSLRRDMEAIDALLDRSAGTGALTLDERAAICTGWSHIGIRLETVRERIAEQCDPWFRVAPTFRDYVMREAA